MISFLERTILLFGILLFAVVSCTERIDIKTDDAAPRLVIYGYISTDTALVRITKSAGYFTTESPQIVSGAEVTVTDSDGGVITLAEIEPGSGQYLNDSGAYGEEGKTYTLDVYFDDNGNRVHYQSEKAYLQHIHQIDSIGLRASRVFRETVEVLLYAWNFGENNNYALFVAINDSVVNRTVNRFFVINDTFFRGQHYIDGVECYFLNQNPDSEYRNEVLNIGDKVTLNINAISHEYATFISNVQSEIRGSNPIFGGPPANVPTNIRRISANGYPALGFFTAYPSRYAHKTVTEEFTFRN